jgi:hypothetical protein
MSTKAISTRLEATYAWSWKILLSCKFKNAFFSLMLSTTLSITVWRPLGSGGIALRILNLVARWRWMVTATLRRLYPRINNPSTYWKLSGHQSRSEWERNSLPLLAIDPQCLSHSSCVLIAVLNELTACKDRKYVTNGSKTAVTDMCITR